MFMLIALAVLLLAIVAFTCAALNCFMSQNYKKTILCLAAVSIMLFAICVIK